MFLINAGIGSYFLYFYWHLKKILLKQLFDNDINRKVKQIDIKIELIINLKNSNSNLLKIDKKYYKEINIYYIGYIAIKTKMMIVKIFTVYILCVCLLIMQMAIFKKKMEINP